MIPRDDLAGLDVAHQRLLRDLDGLSDAEVSAPSVLPGWSVGHVLTHLARNADGLTRIAMAAARGEVGQQYPGGVAQRERDIDAGAGRPAVEQLADLERSIEDLASAFARLDAAAWREGVGEVSPGLRPVAEMPFRRWREVEVHHADLGRPSFTVDHWSEAYVERELDETLGTLAARLPRGVALRIDFVDVPDVVTVGQGEQRPLSGTRREVLAWLTGRARRPELPEVGPWP
jgi:maleylpyruvate isomerase